MRKHIKKQQTEAYLDLEFLASVEISSEDPQHPIEDALFDDTSSGWRAADPGEQIIRIIFDQPLALQSILLKFQASEPRTQEYLLRWSADGQTYSDIVRQQWNFSAEANTEIENHVLNLAAVKILELIIAPDIHANAAYASLTLLRLS